MPIYTGKSRDDSDMQESLDMFINPDNKNKWSNKAYNKEQRQIAKDHKTYLELMDYMNGKYTLQDCYNQIQNKTFPLTARFKKYVLSHYDENGNFIKF